jgi:hypothetical protein
MHQASPFDVKTFKNKFVHNKVVQKGQNESPSYCNSLQHGISAQ